MRVLLDECLPKRLTRELTGHEDQTVQQRGWSGISNGRLLALVAGNFDAFITVDSNLAYQQNLSSMAFAIIVLCVHSNKIEDIHPLLPRLLRTLSVIKPGEIRIIDGKNDSHD